MSDVSMFVFLVVLFVGIIIGGAIGFLLASTPFAARRGWGTQEEVVRMITSEVMNDAQLQTTSVLSQTVDQVTSRMEATQQLTKQTLDSNLDVVNSTIRDLQDRVEKLNALHVSTTASIDQQIRYVTDANTKLHETTQSINNLLSNNQEAGKWGEIALERLVEMSGMSKHVDFQTQVSFDTVIGGDNKTYKPDVLIRFVNDTAVPVDSKFSVQYYREAIHSTDQEYRKKMAMQQLAAIKKHITDLGKKKYHEHIINGLQCLPFTVMYIDIEGVLLFVHQNTGEQIIEFAMKKDIVIATPNTLFALLKTAHMSWRQKAEVEQFAELIRIFKKLGDQMRQMIGLIDTHGKKISEVHKSYDEIVGSWNMNLSKSIQQINDIRSDTFTNDSLKPIEVKEIRELTGLAQKPIDE